jgi:tetratricopeptide (TPR) repeat protein
VAGAAAFWLGVGALAWWSRERFVRVGLLWYAISLLPVIGLVQVGSQAMADRYAYLPAIGAYLALVGGVSSLLRGRGTAPALAAGALAALALGALVWTGQRQIQVWRSTESLFRHALEVTDANFSMHFNLANTLKGRGRIEEAIEHYRTAIAIHPGMSRAHFNLANTLVSEGREAEAIAHYRAAIAATPDLQPARDALGRLLIRQGDLQGSLAHFREEVRRDPDAVEARVTLGHLLRMAGDLEGAARAYEEVARRVPDGTPWRREARLVRAQMRAEAPDAAAE